LGKRLHVEAEAEAGSRIEGRAVGEGFAEGLDRQGSVRRTERMQRDARLPICDDDVSFGAKDFMEEGPPLVI